jgi:hypothetical protein
MEPDVVLREVVTKLESGADGLVFKRTGSCPMGSPIGPGDGMWASLSNVTASKVGDAKLGQPKSTHE